VRARMREHLEALQNRFSGSALRVPIQHTDLRDYAWRISVPLTSWAKVVNTLVLEQTWSNFKSEAQRYGQEQHMPGNYTDLLHEIWALVANKLQWSKAAIGNGYYADPEW
jgi:hypothetical protein